MDILVEDQDRVRHLILNRSSKRNALTMQMCKDIVESVRSAESRNDIGCILITGQGSAFCAGMDLHEAPPIDELSHAHEHLFTMGALALKPIVIAVNGAALAGGLGLVAQGHVVLASSNASFGLPEVRIGFWPFVVYRALEAAMGKRRTLELSLTGASFTADQALAWGLVHRVHSDADLEESANKVAREIAHSSPSAISLGLEYMRDAEGKSLRDAGKIAAALRAKLMVSEDYKEGTAAFREKREPRWSHSADRS